MSVSLDERMRQFVVVAKYAMQTGQVYHYSGFKLRKNRALTDIATVDFQLTRHQCHICYMRARDFIHNIGNGKTSDDMIRELEGRLPA